MQNDDRSSTGQPDVEMFGIEHAVSKPLKDGYDLWQALRGEKPFPSRTELSLRTIGGLASNMILIKVIDGGRDYEFRIVGDVPVATTGHNFQGRRLNEPEVEDVLRHTRCRDQYASVLRSGEPRVFKGRMLDSRYSNLPTYTEAIFMPLSEDGTTIDHLLGFIVFAEEAAP